jgi:hypothetical protein
MKLSFPLFAAGLLGLAKNKFAHAITKAPDLTEVRNVRPGDTAGTTHVDFVFDEEARFANCCQRYQMVPADGSEPIMASTSLDPKGTDQVKVRTHSARFV